MQIYFTNKVDNYEKHQPTVGTQGYANSTEQIQEVVHQELTNIFNNNPDIFGALQMSEEEATEVPPPKETPTEVANAMAAVDILNELCTILTSTARALGRCGTTNQQSETGTNDQSTRCRRNPLLTAQGLDKEGIPIMYCWSCSTTCNLSHTSAACSCKKEGHKDTATLQNKMGGCTGGCAPCGA